MFMLESLGGLVTAKYINNRVENCIPYNYWQAVRATYEREKVAGRLSEADRVACEQILTTEDQVSYGVTEGGSVFAVSSLKDTDLAQRVAWGLSEYDEGATWALESQLQIKTKMIQVKFDGFKEQLRVSYPELADKQFGFVLNELGNLEATSTEELTDREKNLLNGWLNDVDSLKEWAVDHAKRVIALCKMDTGIRQCDDGVFRKQTDMTQYDGMINLENIHKFIDFGRLLQNPNSKAGQGHSWVEQLIVNAEKIREQEAESAPRAEV